MGFENLMRSNKKNQAAYTVLLNEVLAEAALEQKRIETGCASMWSTAQLTKVITPEITELLHFARMGKLFFKYGKKKRMLESVYLLLDSCDDLKDTQLGNKLLELQDLYSRI